MEKGSFLIVCTAILGVLVHFAAAQNVHIVGDGMGWDIPPNSSVSYSNWASGKTFSVGDILVFNFVTNQHDVVQVPRASYDACSQDNAIGNVITTGPANITLNSAGDQYFICTFGRHCQAGQQLAITVGSSSTPGGASPPTTTPPATPTTPATPSPDSPQPDACAPTPSSAPNTGGPSALPTPRTAFPPPPDSSSTSLAASFLLIIGFVCMGLVF